MGYPNPNLKPREKTGAKIRQDRVLVRFILKERTDYWTGGERETPRVSGERKNLLGRSDAKSPLTQISALVVMAFPAYKLIISGARYERVVYLQDNNRKPSNTGQRSDYKDLAPFLTPCWGIFVLKLENNYYSFANQSATKFCLVFHNFLWYECDVKNKIK